jgi:hypothetical protein
VAAGIPDLSNPTAIWFNAALWSASGPVVQSRRWAGEGGKDLKTQELRASMRVPVTHRGMLGSPEDWHHCLIEDISARGFLIISTIKLKVGYVLELKCELFPGRTLMCKIEVRHVSDDCVGTMIVEIDDAGVRLCEEFIDHHARLKKLK